ncbi:hypothetical protein FGB62_49g12 [Gracilaria domingensis]|nr:hypothetical protein FGB62_49g12 [Gracilaria domingensis]
MPGETRYSHKTVAQAAVGAAGERVSKVSEKIALHLAEGCLLGIAVGVFGAGKGGEERGVGVDPYPEFHELFRLAAQGGRGGDEAVAAAISQHAFCANEKRTSTPLNRRILRRAICPHAHVLHSALTTAAESPAARAAAPAATADAAPHLPSPSARRRLPPSAAAQSPVPRRPHAAAKALGAPRAFASRPAAATSPTPVLARIHALATDRSFDDLAREIHLVSRGPAVVVPVAGRRALWPKHWRACTGWPAVARSAPQTPAVSTYAPLLEPARRVSPSNGALSYFSPGADSSMRHAPSSENHWQRRQAQIQLVREAAVPSQDCEPFTSRLDRAIELGDVAASATATATVSVGVRVTNGEWRQAAATMCHADARLHPLGHRHLRRAAWRQSLGLFRDSCKASAVEWTACAACIARWGLRVGHVDAPARRMLRCYGGAVCWG